MTAEPDAPLHSTPHRTHRRTRRLVCAVAAVVVLGTTGLFTSNALGTWACRYHETREGRPFIKHELAHIDRLPADVVPSQRSVREVVSDLPDRTVLTISECDPSLFGRSRAGHVLIEVSAPGPTDADAVDR